MIFRYEDYKFFLKSWIDQQESKGRGQVAKLAEYLDISPSLVSTILNTDRHFSVEQACEISEYLKLSLPESDYLVALISYEKAGSEKLKKYWRAQKKKILKESEQIKSRIKYEKTLSPEQQNQYYSQSIYSQIRVLTTLEGGVTFAQIKSLIKVDDYQIHSVIQFLLDADLVVLKNENYHSTNQVVHINKESSNYLRHHMNWRLLQIQNVNLTENEDVTYTFPCTLNKSDFTKIKKMLLDVISKSHQVVRESPAEEMACLTIDWVSLFRPSK